MSFIYNFMFVLLLVSAIYEVYTNEEPNKNWFYTIVGLMMLTAGLAYGISPDWVAYWNAFEGAAQTSLGELKDLSKALDMEYGYLLLNKLISSVGLGYGAFTLLIAVIALWLKTTTIYKYGGYVFMALLIYYVPTYFFEEQIHVRQGMANAITIFSIRYIINRDLRRFLICLVVAFYFHKSAVAFLLAYWIVKIKFNNVTIIVLVGLAVVANAIGLSTQIDGIMQFMPFGVAETYNDYADAVTENSILGDIVKVLIVIAILMFNNIVEKKDELYPYFRNIYVFGVILYFFFGNGIFATRLPGFYTVFLVFLVPHMVKALKDNTTFKNIVFISFTAYIITLFGHFYNTWSEKTGFDDYETFFNRKAPYSFFQRN
ncbi:MAG: EpsG family protein [Moheibacter sp.]